MRDNTGLCSIVVYYNECPGPCHFCLLLLLINDVCVSAPGGGGVSECLFFFDLLRKALRAVFGS